MAAYRSGVHGVAPTMWCGLAMFFFGAAAAAADPTVTEPARATDSGHPELRVQAVRPGISVVSGPGWNVTVWAGTDGVVLVDSGATAAEDALFEAIRRVAPGPLRFVINTARQLDHAGNNAAAAKQGAVLIGHESLRESNLRPSVTGPEEGAGIDSGGRPVLTTADSLALHMNGDRLEVVHVADAHSAADMVVRWAEADVTCLGDLYWNGQYPLIDREAGGSLAGVVAAVEAVLARATSRTVMIPGHGPVSTRAELAAYRDMLVTVGRKVREAVEQGRGLEEILEARPTAEFDARFAKAGAPVSADAFVSAVYRDLTRGRSGR